MLETHTFKDETKKDHPSGVEGESQGELIARTQPTRRTGSQRIAFLVARLVLSRLHCHGCSSRELSPSMSTSHFPQNNQPARFPNLPLLGCLSETVLC